MEKKCETCWNRFKDPGLPWCAEPCCSRQPGRVDKWKPALPEKHEGLTEQEALIAAKDGWEAQEELGSEEFWCKNVMGSAFRHRVYTYKITGRREGK